MFTPRQTHPPFKTPPLRRTPSVAVPVPRIGQAGDACEHEADAFADQVW